MNPTPARSSIWPCSPSSAARNAPPTNTEISFLGLASDSSKWCPPPPRPASWKQCRTAERGTSDRDHVEIGVETSKILRIRGDDLLIAAPGADHDMGVGDV